MSTRREVWTAIYKKLSPTESVPVAFFADAEDAAAFHENPAVYSSVSRTLTFYPGIHVEQEAEAIRLLRDIIHNPQITADEDRRFFAALARAGDLLREIDAKETERKLIAELDKLHTPPTP